MAETPLTEELTGLPVSKYIRVFVAIEETGYNALLDSLKIPKDDRERFDNADALAEVHNYSIRPPIGRATIVVLDPKKLGRRAAPARNAIIVHECVHIWQRYCEAICEYRPGDEIEAHAIQDLFEAVAEAYDRLLREQRRRRKDAKCRDGAKSETPSSSGAGRSRAKSS